jgi:SAM-dependent methyltransferase
MSRAPSPDKRPGWHWSEYWRSGRADVLTVQTADGSSPVDTASVWQAFGASFEEGARVLDLATGGGHVARNLVRGARDAGRSIAVHGVDYADLGPLAGPSPEGFTLQGGVALESLPFAAATFDGATSQFGIEYADHRAALRELARVLKPGGRALMLLHHADSPIGRSAASQLAAFDTVLGEGAAMRQARRAFTAHLKRLPPPALEAAEAAFRAAVDRMAARLRDDPDFDQARALVGYLHDLATNVRRFGPESALARLDQTDAINDAWRRRQRAQVQAALDETGLAAFLARAGREGLDAVESGEERNARDEPLAWRVGLRRS